MYRFAALEMGSRDAVACLRDSLTVMRMDYVDVYLVHYPKPSYNDNNDQRNAGVRKKVWHELEQALGSFCSLGLGGGGGLFVILGYSPNFPAYKVKL